MGKDGSAQSRTAAIAIGVWEVELPSHCSDAWANGDGEVIVTDDRELDPNRDADPEGKWLRMQAL